MAKYLLDTNAYFAVLKYIVGENRNPAMEAIANGDCYISELTQIEIISVIGQYARGKTAQKQVCDRVHGETGEICGKIFVTRKRKRSMDAMILGTARAYSTDEDEMIVVTADKVLKAGMGRAGYPFILVTQD